jgi:hypothetical protein
MRFSNTVVQRGEIPGGCWGTDGRPYIRATARHARKNLALMHLL